jgi:hypothetical protein
MDPVLVWQYPHLTAGSVASSAPVRAKSDFFEYMEVVDAALQCVMMMIRMRRMMMTRRSRRMMMMMMMMMRLMMMMMMMMMLLSSASAGHLGVGSLHGRGFGQVLRGGRVRVGDDCRGRCHGGAAGGE